MPIGKIVNTLGGILGLNTPDGPSYGGMNMNSIANQRLQQEADQTSSASLNKLINDYAQGRISLEQALGSIQQNNPNDYQSMVGLLATNPAAASRMASDQVRGDPLAKGLLGEGGSMERALGEEKDLASRGYSLQPEDYEAYGQAGGNIARLFGTQEQSLAQALADRGLGAASSGVAQQGFSNLYGNKFEQLGQLQRQIADDRMTKNLDRLNSTRSYLTNMGNLGQTALQNQFNRNLSGNQQRIDMLRGASQSDLAQKQAQSASDQAALESQAANRGVSLFDVVRSGTMKGIGSGISGGLGAILGGKLGGIGGYGDEGAEAGGYGGTTRDMRRKGVL